MFLGCFGLLLRVLNSGLRHGQLPQVKLPVLLSLVNEVLYYVQLEMQLTKVQSTVFNIDLPAFESDFQCFRLFKASCNGRKAR